MTSNSDSLEYTTQSTTLPPSEVDDAVIFAAFAVHAGRFADATEVALDLGASHTLDIDVTAEALVASVRARLPEGCRQARVDAIEGVVAPTDGGMQLTLRAPETEVAARLAAWVELVRGLAARADARTLELSMLPADVAIREVATQLDAMQAYEASTPLHRLIEAAVDRDPSHIAVRVPGEDGVVTSYDYATLDRAANRIANVLLASGLESEGCVGVRLDRGFELVASILGVLKAGGTYLPIDLSYPAERVRFMLADSKARLLITASGLSGDLGEIDAELLELDTQRARLEAASADRPAQPVDPEALAYVIYTSGSTGTPKGVMVSHANVARLLSGTAHWFAFGAHDVWTLFHSHAFDVSVFELFGALGHGGTLVVVPYLVSRDPESFRDLIVSERVTVLSQTPSAFSQLSRADQRNSAVQHSLRLVIFAGEALELSSLQPWIERYGDDAPQLINMYGITETTVHVTYRRILAEDVAARRGSLIGVPIPDLGLFVLDEGKQPLPVGAPGELYVAGAGLARGYLAREDLTADRFAHVELPGGRRVRLYRSGDKARRTPDGDLEYLGRLDMQIKLRGFRIELGEIEARIRDASGAPEVCVLVRDDGTGQRLVAYVVPGEGGLDAVALRAKLSTDLPSYMVPAAFVTLEALPLTANGKLDRRSLPAPTSARPELAAEYVAPTRALEVQISEILAEKLDIERVGLDDNFFDLGANSMFLTGVAEEITERLGKEVPVVTMFAHATVRALAAALGGADEEDVVAKSASQARSRRSRGSTRPDVAIVGMAGRFPGADDVQAFWQNLVDGKDTIDRFTEAQLAGSELDYAAVKDDSAYVPARGIVRDAECFDHSFFGYNPREAKLMDPQHRVFLEAAWHALEDAGIDPGRYEGRIGVVAGSYTNNYLLYHLAKDRTFIERYVRTRSPDAFQILFSNDKDFVATRVAYELDLKGPALTVQSACSTSLVATVKAYQAILEGEADVCLAGGVCISVPQVRGYLYNEGAMVSKDGHCRAFDENAAGTVFSNGAGVVVLKRLEDAQRDGDQVYAVIRGAALNNDGARKVSYTAPSVDGQASVIAAAQAIAGVRADDIDYVEAHGTGTPLGDPIEVEALTKAFRLGTDRKQYCGVGSVKTNVGHLDAAAGVTGLMKAALCLSNETLTKTVHFERPNPRISLEDSPFYVVDETRPWPRGERVRRAGVSAFGVGGTNAHVVLEEGPAAADTSESARAQVLLLSAADEDVLGRVRAQLADYLEANPDVPLADIAHTLRVGRSALAWRQAVVASDAAEAIARLRRPTPVFAPRGQRLEAAPRIVFAFPGQGAQHVHMGRALYESEPSFRADVDALCERLQPILDLDLRRAMFPGEGGDLEEAARILQETGNTQPAIFVVEYAVARWLMQFGLRPDLMIGHSVGEYTAACLAGVFSVEDAAAVLATRARLMQSMPKGSMRAVRLSEGEVSSFLEEGVSLAGLNGPKLCVVSGPKEAIEAFDARLEAAGHESITLHTSHAFHSSMMDPVLEPFADAVRGVERRAPSLPIVSTRTGRPLSDAEATDPAYWAGQLRDPVRFSPAVQAILSEGPCLFVEVGPSQNLCAALRQHSGAVAIPTLPKAKDDFSALQTALGALGALFTHGVDVDWATLTEGEVRRKVRLPGYPFARVPHMVEAPPLPDQAEGVETYEAQEDLEVEAAPTGTRRDRIQARLQGIMTELSGVDIAADQLDVPFTEMGFDSLFLTQASAELKSQLGVKVRFRRLMEDVTTVSALTDLLESELPAEAFTEAPKPKAKPRRPAPGGPASGTSDSPYVQQVIDRQLALMKEQLEVLRGGAGGPAKASASAAVSDTYGRLKAYKKPFSPYRPINKAKDGGLTAAQQAHLDALIERLATKTKSSKADAARYRAVHTDPRGVSGFRAVYKELVYQLVMTRSLGPHLWDADGNQYVDITGGFGINFLGYSPPYVREAVEAQLKNGTEISPQSPHAGEVAERFCKMTGNERVFFVNTGSEAVNAALRIARTVTGRSRIVYFSEAYHGVFDEVLGRAQIGKGRVTTLPGAPGVTAGAVDEALVLDYGDPESLDILRAQASEIAAVLVEPVQSRHPDNQPIAFLKEVRKITEASGTALIIDEVITGFRYHQGGIQTAWGIRGDLATYGKVIGGGMPIGVLAGRARFMDAIDGGAWSYGDDSVPEADVTYFAGTFHRHPLALAAAKAVLTHLENEGPELQARMNERTAAFAGRMNAFFEEVGAPIQMPHFASWFRFEFPGDQLYMPLLAFHLLDRGIYCRQITQNNFLSTTHTDAHLEQIEAAIKEGVLALQEVGFIARSAGRTASGAGSAGKDAWPLTEGQREIWLTSQMSEAASCAFNESFSLLLEGSLDDLELEAAIVEVVGRHEALQTVFDKDGGMQRKVAGTPKLARVDASSEDAALEALLDEEARTAFDLENGPLYRFKLVRLGADRHQLVMTMHHSVLDGWAAAVVIDEIATLYSTKRRGAQPSLPKPDAFSAYVDWERAVEQGEEGREAIAYWKALYAEEAPALELPTDRPRPPLKSFAGGSYSGVIAAEVADAARAAAKARGVTPFAFLLSTFEVLLARLSGQREHVVGVPVAGQATAGMPNLVGHCVSFLPLRLSAGAEEPFAEVLVRTRSALLDAQDHQHATFGQIVNEVRFSKARNRLPFIQAVFNFDKPLMVSGFEGLEAKVWDNAKRHVNFDLFLNLSDAEGGFEIKLDYDTDLFDEATVASWMGAFEALLAGASASTDALVGKLPVLGRDVEQRVLQEWNHRPLELPQTTLHARIQETAAANSHKLAVSGGGVRLTYAELVAEAASIARGLGHRGVNRHDRVGVLVERTPRAVSALLGVLRAGAAYVPLDSKLPEARLRLIVEDAGLVGVLADGTALPEGLDVPRFALDELLETGEEGGLPELGSPDDLAYVIYTSGSTGRPKGVKIPHRAAVGFLASMAQTPGLNAQDILLAVTTFSFDIHVLEVFLPLVVGATVHVARADELVGGAAIQDALASSGATVMQATPSMWRVLVDSGWTPKPGFKALSGGEALPRDLANALASGAETWNMFGPTETTVWSLVDRVQAGEGSVPIGRPIHETKVYVLDAAGAPVPIGVPGELFIGGFAVADGYHARPELDAERFVADPFAGGAARMYRTGDLAKYRADGVLEYLGRLDFQVKVRGHRIELEEIEAALGTHEAVKEVCVVVREDRADDKRIVAYYVPAAGMPATSTELRKHLEQKLPAAMIPQHFVDLEAMPRTPNGKTDRKQLLEAHAIGAVDEARFVPATTEAQKMLTGLFASALGVERVGITDNFFALGGHSLLAMSVLLEIEKRTGQRWSTQQMVFMDVAQLAGQLEPKVPEPATRPSSPPPAAPVRDPEPGSSRGLGSRLFRRIKSKVSR